MHGISYDQHQSTKNKVVADSNTLLQSAFPGIIDPYSISRASSYHYISPNLEAVKYVFVFVLSLWYLTGVSAVMLSICLSTVRGNTPSGPTFIKPDQLDPWIKDQIKITLLSTIAPLQLPNFVSCGRDKPSHMTQNLVTVETKLWTAERFLVDPWSMDQADLVW